MKDKEREAVLLAVSTNVDDLADRLKALAEISQRIAVLTAQAEAIKKEVKEALGDSQGGTIAGRLVVTNATTRRFDASGFAERHPGLVDAYTVDRTVREIDLVALRTDRPDVFAEFSVRSMRVDRDALALAVDDLANRRVEEASRAAQTAWGAPGVTVSAPGAGGRQRPAGAAVDPFQPIVWR